MNLQQFEIKRLFEEERLPIYKIGKLLEITQSRVRQALRESGIDYNLIFNDSDEIKEIIRLFQEGKSFREIESITGKTYTHVRMSLIERGYTETKTPDTSPEMIDEIIKLYNEGNSSSKVGKLLGISSTTVKRFIPKELKKSKSFYNAYSCNYQFFENIDNEVKAYFLGLMYADGCNNETKKCLQLGFAEKDKELLYKFMEAIESNHRIDVRKKRGGNSQEFYRVTISSPILSEHLTKHGCVSAKTHVLEKMPILSDELYRHFIRGYFDGDGSVWYSLTEASDKINISFTGNKPFLEDVQNHLIEKLGIGKPSIYIRHKTRNNSIGDLRYACTQARKVLEWMYNDCQYYSERKKEISLKQKFEEQLM